LKYVEVPILTRSPSVRNTLRLVLLCDPPSGEPTGMGTSPTTCTPPLPWLQCQGVQGGMVRLFLDRVNSRVRIGCSLRILPLKWPPVQFSAQITAEQVDMKYYILCMQNKTLLCYVILFYCIFSVLKGERGNNNWVHMRAHEHMHLLHEEAHEVCITLICHQTNILNLIQQLRVTINPTMQDGWYV
jgi:hypothetical protein